MQEMRMTQLRVIIIGAGIVGLAVGLEFMQRYPDADLTILEKEDDVKAPDRAQ